MNTNRILFTDICRIQVRIQIMKFLKRSEYEYCIICFRIATFTPLPWIALVDELYVRKDCTQYKVVNGRVLTREIFVFDAWYIFVYKYGHMKMYLEQHLMARIMSWAWATRNVNYKPIPNRKCPCSNYYALQWILNKFFTSNLPRASCTTICNCEALLVTINNPYCGSRWTVELGNKWWIGQRAWFLEDAKYSTNSFTSSSLRAE